MDRHPLRSDKQYNEIEKFKDYEVTQCIAYEMAIRNPMIQKMIEQRGSNRAFGAFDESWMRRLNLVKDEGEMNKLLLEYIHAEPGRIKKLKEEEALNKKITELAFFPIPLAKPSKIDQLMKNPFFIEYQNRASQRAQLKKTSIVNDNRIESYFEDDGSAKTIAGGSIRYDILFPKFSRPIPIIPTKVSKEIDAMLNLALPIDDIIKYIEAIKRAYEKSNGEALQAATPLDDIASIAKKIATIEIKTKKKGSKTNLEMPEKSKQEVYADLFFLYDVFRDDSLNKKGDKIYHFRSEMIDYYATKVCKYHRISNIDEVSDHIGTPRDQSVRDYYKVMQHYIDDFGYKKLIA